MVLSWRWRCQSLSGCAADCLISVSCQVARWTPLVIFSPSYSLAKVVLLSSVWILLTPLAILRDVEGQQSWPSRHLITTTPQWQQLTGWNAILFAYRFQPGRKHRNRVVHVACCRQSVIGVDHFYFLPIEGHSPLPLDGFPSHRESSCQCAKTGLPSLKW